MSRPTASSPRRRTVSSPSAGVFLAFLVAQLAGCSLFGGGDDSPLIPKPEFLQPEIDAFTEDSARTYYWTEIVRRDNVDGGDTLLSFLALEAVHTGDTTAGTGTIPRVRLAAAGGNAGLPFSAAAPAPAAALSRLGLPPDRVAYDTLIVPDAGPAIGFPFNPIIGWRRDTVVGDLRFVRVLDRVQTVKQGGVRYECWTFAESTYVDDTGTLLGTGVTWMGRNGLVRHRSEWPAYVPSSTAPGILFREITAQ